jgi:uncharacterized membrane protein YdjX (TVP38/TMEM64 family)
VLTATHRQMLHPEALKSAIGSSMTAPLIFLLLHVVASLIFIPRTLMAAAAGLLFGAVGGFIWATLGSLLGAVAGFLLARYVNDGLLEPESMPKIGPLLQKAEAGGWRAVALIRLIPILPHPIANYGLGLTRLSLTSYMLGSLIGQIPMTIAYVDFGAAGDRALSGGANWVTPTVIGAAALILSLVLPKFAARKS